MNTYTCEQCGKTYDKGWSDEEAFAETRANFGNIDPNECAVVCDDCYQEILERAVQSWLREPPHTTVVEYLENRALAEENPYLLALVLALKEGKDPQIAIQEEVARQMEQGIQQIIQDLLTPLLDPRLNSRSWTHSPQTGRYYKKRILKKKLKERTRIDEAWGRE